MLFRSLMNVVALAVAIPLFYSVTGGAQIRVLAFGYVCGFWATFIVSWILLARRLGGMESGRTLLALLRIIVAGAVSAVAMLVVWVLLTAYVSPIDLDHKPSLLLEVVGVAAVGGLVYLVAAWVLRIGEIRDVMAMVRRRVPIGRSGT